MKNLSLEGNLVFDWNQIYMIGKELKSLEWLSLSNNRLSEPEDITEQKKIFINSNDTYIDVPPLGNIFQNLKTLILINMGLNWKILGKILPALLNVESLVLCYNQFNDFDNLKFTGKDFPNLSFLNLEGNGLESFEGVKMFKDAPKLERLIVSKNKIKDLGDATGFENLKQFIIEENEISDFRLFSQLNKFGSVLNLRVTKNPIYNKFTALHIRQRAIAEIKSLTQANGSELKKLERKDCEIYYLRDSFREYFELTGQNPEKYFLDQFLEYCSKNHPRVPELIQLYGNPYEDVKTDGTTTTTTRKMASFVNVKLYALCGPSLGKPAQTKKFTDNTLITNLKAMLAKQFGIPANKQRIWHKADPHDPFVPLEEDLKDLNYYGVREGHEIWVGDEETEV
jgi:Leucine-rich repeat (LRR) protein